MVDPVHSQEPKGEENNQMEEPVTERASASSRKEVAASVNGIQVHPELTSDVKDQ